MDDEEKFNQLFSAHYHQILGYSLRRVANAELAQDVTSNVFMTAWRRIEDVPPGNEAKLWLFGVARRMVANQNRSSQRKTNLNQKLVSTYEGVEPEKFSIERFMVHHALSELDEDEYELITLTIWEGLKKSEVARTLGIPQATVRTRLFRIRRKLKKILDTEHADASFISGNVTDTTAHVHTERANKKGKETHER